MTVDCLLHVHSSFSYDSKTDLQEIADRARAEGIGCVLMSEHNNTLDASQVAAFVSRCQALSDERLLIVPGLELALDSNQVHLLAYGLGEYVRSSDPGCQVGDLLPHIRRHGGVAVLAHPSHKQAFTRVAPRDLALLDGVEIWNVKNGNRFCPDASEIRSLRGLRATSPSVSAFAGLDLHHLSRWVRLVSRLDVPALTREAVLGTLRAGQFRIHGPFVDIASDAEASLATVAGYDLVSRVTKNSRRVAYRWQSKLERRGWNTPRSVAKVGRRLF
jgi:hypothetical protein